MLDWIWNTHLICNANQLHDSYLIQIFTENFSQAGYWNMDLDSNNSTKYIQTLH